MGILPLLSFISLEYPACKSILKIFSSFLTAERVEQIRNLSKRPDLMEFLVSAIGTDKHVIVLLLPFH